MTLERKDGKMRGDLLPDAADLWPTLRAMTGGPESAARKKELGRVNSGGGDIQAAVMDWGTPSRPGPTTTPDGEWCSAFVQSLPRRKLNPWFVEWLMGFPPGWLDATGVPSCEVSAMLSALPSPKRSAKASSGPTAS